MFFFFSCSNSAKNKRELNNNLGTVDSIVISKTVKNIDALIQQDIFIYMRMPNEHYLLRNVILDSLYFGVKYNNQISLFNTTNIYKEYNENTQTYALAILIDTRLDFSLREIYGNFTNLFKDSVMYIYYQNKMIDSLSVNLNMAETFFKLDGVKIDSNDYLNYNLTRIVYWKDKNPVKL